MEKPMLDIRYPIGGMFIILGAILVVFGVVSDPRLYEVHSLGININLGWGCVILAFGIFMLTLAWRARQRSKQRERSP
jgi:protein-S-isoprenylcysteine O-methyltransferase Ste14